MSLEDRRPQAGGVDAGVEGGPLLPAELDRTQGFVEGFRYSIVIPTQNLMDVWMGLAGARFETDRSYAIVALTDCHGVNSRDVIVETTPDDGRVLRYYWQDGVPNGGLQATRSDVTSFLLLPTDQLQHFTAKNQAGITLSEATVVLPPGGFAQIEMQPRTIADRVDGP